MSECDEITDAGLAHLRGIHSLNMGACEGITDAGLAHLSGIHTLDMRGCGGITGTGFVHIVGIRALIMRTLGLRFSNPELLRGPVDPAVRPGGCRPAVIAAALALGLPVE